MNRPTPRSRSPDFLRPYVAGGYYEEGKGLHELAREMEDNVRMGARAVKMKVGGVPIAEDAERVRVVSLYASLTRIS